MNILRDTSLESNPYLKINCYYSQPNYIFLSHKIKKRGEKAAYF